MNFSNHHHHHCHHIHCFKGITSCNCCHFHCFTSNTGPARLCCNSHVHEFVTRFGNPDHYHEIRGFTSEAIYLPNGCHIHIACGITSFNKCHNHFYNFSTSIEIPINH